MKDTIKKVKEVAILFEIFDHLVNYFLKIKIKGEKKLK